MLIPVRGTDPEWWKNILQNPRVKIRSNNQTFNGKIQTITQKTHVSEAIELFSKKYGPADFRKYYPNPNVAGSLRVG